MQDFNQQVIEAIAAADSAGQAVELLYQAVNAMRPILSEQIAVNYIAGWIDAIESTFHQLPAWIQEDILSTPRSMYTGRTLWAIAAGMGSVVPETSAIIEAISKGDRNPFFPDDESRFSNLPELGANRLFPPPPEPPESILQFDSFGSSGIRFPKIERAASSLLSRNVVTRQEFDSMVDNAKRSAFTIAGDLSERAIDQYRNILVDDIARGTSFEIFRDEIGNTVLSPDHLENVYRTNTQAAFRDGREAILRNPVVDAMFPYQEYIAIHDGRTRRNHKQLETLGLDGTAVYRRDDPFWDKFTPPIDYNCRCGVNVLTVEAAARKGVREAEVWLKTGIPPSRPNWRLASIPFESRPGFGHRSSVGAY